MFTNRIIPVLLFRNGGLVKTVRFREPKYVGDPINAIRIFNDKEVDELVFLDITATVERREPPFERIAEVAAECFIPFAYGGGIRDLRTAERIFSLGAEKIVINSAAVENPEMVREATRLFGSQSVVGSIDVKRSFGGKYEVYVRSGTINTHKQPQDYARMLEDAGVGEVLLNSIDRDGTMRGYDHTLIKQVTVAVGVPVVASGGAGCLRDMVDAIRLSGASAAAAGSLFVFQGKHRAVLITYPERGVIQRELLKQQ